jgi:hypothetical protein
MPRHARTVFANLPDHDTQRGNRREGVFFDDEHRKTDAIKGERHLSSQTFLAS